jgi:beta-galactosidase
MKTFFARLLAFEFATLAACVGAFGAPVQTERLSLAGQWRFQLDRGDAGMSDRWFERSLDQRIKLPGALQNQGIGDDITADTKWTGEVGVDTWLKGSQYEKYRQPGNIKVPFFLQPEKHYTGAAWYQRDVEIPAAWQGKRVVLSLERPHWETRVWLDGKAVGTNTSLSTPHAYDLGAALAPGKHTLTIRVDNRVIVNVGAWAHSVTDHTQGNWNGIVGDISLRATASVWIEDVQVYPALSKAKAKVVVSIGNQSNRPGTGNLSVSISGRPPIGASAAPATPMPVFVKWDKNGGSVEFEVVLPGQQAWDEFTPRLYTLGMHLMDLADSTSWLDSKSVSFGLREIGTEGKQFRLNDHPAFFRGTLECCIFPLTGYPPTDVESWMRVIGACKAHGLNLIRFHSWCPPEAAFVAADELGFYFQVECAVWSIPGEDKALGEWLYAESERIVRAYGNHPSFLLLTHGNEPHGKNRDPFLAGWVNYWKQRDPRHLVTSGSAYPQLPENHYHVYARGRGPQGWLGKDYRADVEALNVPVVVHEMGQWCVYPNFDEVRKYTGPLKPKNFDIFRDSLAEHGMLEQWRDFLRASGKLQALCYKEEIEAALRTPGIGGFELLDLHDFPGQGTALVGVLDPFWESKGYITPAEYRRFCSPTVPLARVLKRVWTTDETFSAEVEIAHFGPAPLENAVPVWKLVSQDGKALAKGEFAAKSIPLGQGTPLGRVSTPFASIPAIRGSIAQGTPLACKLVVGLKGTPFENDWNVWIYPARLDATPPADVLIKPSLDPEAFARLDAGGRVLLLPFRLSRAHPRLTFEPIFWNRYMFHTQARQTLGLLCDPKHPALAQFPTASFQDWQWDEIVTPAQAMVLDALPKDLHPIVQPIDDWNTNRKLGLVWECRVGNGKLLVCSADLVKDLGTRPAARQLRESLLSYMAGKAFNPKVAVSKDALARLLDLTQPSRLATLGARVIEVDSEDVDGGNVAAHAIDGDDDTFWHTRWQQVTDPMPHHITIDLGRSLTLKGVTYLPRQKGPNGRIAECEIYCSTNPTSWAAPTAKVKWPNTSELQAVRFKQPVSARYLKVVARSEVNGRPYASIAELDVLTDEK